MSDTGGNPTNVQMEENIDLRDEALTTLLKRLAQDAQTLIRQEIELAKTEVREQVEQAKDTAQHTVTQTKAEATHGFERVKDEATENGKKAATAVGMYAAAGVLALFLLGCLTAAAIAGLSEAVPTWAAALIVAVVYAVIIAVIAAMAKKRLNDALPLVEPATIQTTKDRITSEIKRGKAGVTEAMPPVPEQTVETIKEDIEWAKNQPRSEKR